MEIKIKCGKQIHFENGHKNNYRKEIHFENGYGLSIISHEFSYGGKTGMFEIALLESESGKIVYDSDLGFEDVLGHLDFEKVASVIQRVRNYVRV